jgi:hypothetical protein
MIRTVALAASLALVSGCSVALQKKPASNKVATSECSTTSAYWIADYTGVAAGAGGLALAVTGQDSDAKMAIGYSAALAGLVYLASAMNGQKWARQCREQRETMPVASR